MSDQLTRIATAQRLPSLAGHGARSTIGSTSTATYGHVKVKVPVKVIVEDKVEDKIGRR